MTTDDNKVIRGFRKFDADITKEFFYGYCRRAYRVLDAKYQLQNKVGLDFYSLAHEYYLQLLAHDFKQLTDRPKKMKLSAFMFKGFWFVTMDALKAHNKEFDSSTDADLVMQYVRSSDHEEGMMEQVAEAVSRHYNDRIMSELAWALFVFGYKQNEVGAQMGLTPSAINQRYKKMMEEVVTPFVIENYGSGIYYGKCSSIPAPAGVTSAMPHLEMCEDRSMAFENINLIEENMANNRVTPEYITTLRENEIFVFGSNLQGMHAGGAARMAYLHFGAEMGKGVGMQGQSYAIPTMQGGVETIKPYVDEFLAYATQHPDLHFLVTPIGCGIAGFEPEDIAPLFAAATTMENVSLPESFLAIL